MNDLNLTWEVYLTDICESVFAREVVREGFEFCRTVGWPTEASTLEELTGFGYVARERSGDDQVAVLRTQGAVALLTLSEGFARARVAGPAKVVEAALAALQERLPRAEPSVQEVKMTFWRTSRRSYRASQRSIPVPGWEEIQENYPRNTRDPEGDSLDEVGADRWRVLILEDTGEILRIDAKSEVGQGLSRLLNVVDGLLGQGLRILLLVTSNEELGRLHPAVVRPGRCAAEIEFRAFAADEAKEWMRRRGHDGLAPPTRLAEMFAAVEGVCSRSPAARSRERLIGFSV